ncbi:MAG: HAMP domain-containing histidine kinase [Oscillospiraceae bacterium]|nr:HAMP domain-containing histidine kinase [Oscillospiraceae bacterium]
MTLFRFKSLTMRIWATFTAVILIITLCLTIIYLYFFRYMDTRAKTQDLMDVHSYIMYSSFDETMRFDLFRSLRGASHFTYSNGNIYDIARPPMGGQPGQPDGQPGRAPPPNITGGASSPAAPFDGAAVRNWIAGFAAGGMAETPFHKKFHGMNFIFVISALDEGAYFISYMPNDYDDNTMYYMLLISGLFIIVGFVAARIIANYISKPLSRLEDFTKRIAAKDWGEPIVINNEDEISRLAASMNKMQDALKRADEDEKMFLQSISHDLKTPVMVIMSHADAIIDGVYVETLDKTAGIIKDEAISLNKRIKQLLYLNTLDYALGNQAAASAIALEDVLARVVERFELLGGGIDWEVDVEPATIMGDEEKFVVAIENILDNALRYAKTKITVTAKKGQKSVRIEIHDDGGGIEPDNIEKIFLSLYKEKTGNFGLGLAITKKIITFFGGSVYAVNKAGGASFIVEYPLP